MNVGEIELGKGQEELRGTRTKEQSSVPVTIFETSGGTTKKPVKYCLI
jgi:hypothetical protein